MGSGRFCSLPKGSLEREEWGGKWKKKIWGKKKRHRENEIVRKKKVLQFVVRYKNAKRHWGGVREKARKSLVIGGHPD